MKSKIFTILLLILIILNCTSYATTDKNLNQNNELSLYSEAAILIDSNTGLVLFSKNATEKMFPASTTKILTAIIAIEKCNLDDIVTVSKSAISAIPAGYSSAYLSEGEQISIKNLLTVFLVHSANDAGYVLAEYISGSIPEFAKIMNDKAKEIGCTNTNFTNPSGIHNENHYSTAYDLSLIAKYCMKNSIFRAIVSMESCTIEPTNKFETRKYINTNDFLNSSSKYFLEDCIGIKTGYTSEARNCLISAYYKDNLELISVVLSADQTESGESARYIDSLNLYKYGYTNYSFETFANKDDIIKNITIEKASKDTKNLDLILADSISGIKKINEDLNDPIISIGENISAPITKNDVVGTITYSIDGISYSENLLASHEVKKNNFLLIILKIALGIILIIILSRILISNLKKQRKKNKKYYINY